MVGDLAIVGSEGLGSGHAKTTGGELRNRGDLLMAWWCVRWAVERRGGRVRRECTVESAVDDDGGGGGAR